jgi:hypothetical protein
VDELLGFMMMFGWLLVVGLWFQVESETPAAIK